ncbi:MAG: ABC-F family ATP-binding cassette domain-containing protein [Clostridia bacterium]|nr:ABC-F family ATP-binding cassette domain-containing protein [Clostridia bacterium]
MPLVSAQNVTAGFLDNVLFRGACFDIQKHDRVGLIGANGVGKTTLFKLILGQLEATEGTVTVPEFTRVGNVEQHTCSDFTVTAYEEVLKVYADVAAMERELETLNERLSAGADPALIERQETLREQFEARDGLSYRSRARSALTGLGFTPEETDMPVGQLSGGQRTKISLAKLLLSGADLILLDEPTNHLDTDSVEWLEGFLKKYVGAAVIISHDRYFLDRTTEKTMEIEGGRLFFTKGNYSTYHKLKQERLLAEQRENEKTEKEIKRIEAMIEQQRSFNRERNFITIASKEKQIERLRATLHEKVRTAAEMKLKFPVALESGNEVLNVHGLSKRFGDKKLFSDVSFLLRKHEKLFIIGPNGCGKTTFLRILMNQLRADAGTVDYGANVRPGYFEQTQSALRSGKTVLAEVYDKFPSMSVPQLRNILAAFLFRGDDIEKRMDELSGGERAKVALLEIMLRGCNLLILDEPTNHLDIASREVLEEALRDYEGTVVAVSHDRYFINRVATKILYFDGGTMRTLDGNYDDYLAIRDAAPAETKAPEKEKKSEYLQKKEAEKAEKQRRSRLAKVEKELAETEERIRNVETELASPSVSADYLRVAELTEALASLNERLDSLTGEWMELAE